MDLQAKITSLQALERQYILYQSYEPKIKETSPQCHSSQPHQTCQLSPQQHQSSSQSDGQVPEGYQKLQENQEELLPQPSQAKTQPQAAPAFELPPTVCEPTHQQKVKSEAIRKVMEQITMQAPEWVSDPQEWRKKLQKILKQK